MTAIIETISGLCLLVVMIQSWRAHRSRRVKVERGVIHVYRSLSKWEVAELQRVWREAQSQSPTLLGD